MSSAYRGECDLKCDLQTSLLLSVSCMHGRFSNIHYFIAGRESCFTCRYLLPFLVNFALCGPAIAITVKLVSGKCDVRGGLNVTIARLFSYQHPGFQHGSRHQVQMILLTFSVCWTPCYGLLANGQPYMPLKQGIIVW